MLSLIIYDNITVTIQKRLNEAEELIQWVNKEEQLYKLPISKFTEIEEVTSAIEPFLRLFQVVFKWQRAEKKFNSITYLLKYVHT